MSKVTIRDIEHITARHVSDRNNDFEPTKSDERAAGYAMQSRIEKEVRDEISGEAAIQREINDQLRQISASGEELSESSAYAMVDRIRRDHSHEGKVEREVQRRMATAHDDYPR